MGSINQEQEHLGIGRGIRRRIPLSFLIAIALVSTFFFQAQTLLRFVHLSITDDEEVKHLDSSSYSGGFTSTHRLDYGTCTDNITVPNNWCIDNDQTPRYVGNIEWPPRMIQHYTHEGYDKCLAEKTIVFIGDSRVRYQFMNLAAFLKFKRFMKCHDYININQEPTHYDPECYLIDHKDRGQLDQKMEWRGWTPWYQQSTILLDSNEVEYQQSGLCDCFRLPSGRVNPKQTYENRYIKRSTRFGETNLIYLQNFENLIRLNQEYPPFSPFLPTQKRCKPGECGSGNRTNAFEGDLNATLWNMLPRLNTTHAFVNLGWEHTAEFQQQSDFSCVIRDFERHFPDIKLFLISHPPPTNDLDDPVHHFDATKLKCDANVLDRSIVNKNVPKDWYWDTQHVLSILNEEYNHQMVEKICPLKGH
mmetsp:Transcript_9921/g.14722  ORF Transcript_9921/g.14722 Transcript_9921/m.14722 type:complete len:418 (+) Transcript_9921:88-1341(+)